MQKIQILKKEFIITVSVITELITKFSISGSVLRYLAAAYFYPHIIIQIPVFFIRLL